MQRATGDADARTPPMSEVLAANAELSVDIELKQLG